MFLVVGGIRGAPFVLTGSRKLRTMIDLANIQPGEKAVDLGSGDGRIVIAFAKAGAEAHGYEINPFLVLWSRYRINRAGLSGRAFVYWRDFWRVDLASFNVIAVFGMVHVMGPLERKLRRELRPGSRVVSNTFTFPRWTRSSGGGGVYLYEQV
jgi:cyclopropane fatty-acyl-phospholipid synthase-like methyltransferase